MLGDVVMARFRRGCETQRFGLDRDAPVAHRVHVLIATAAVALFGGCEPNEITAVGVPGTVYRPGLCEVDDLAAGGRACPTGAQLAFELPGDEATVEIRSATLSARHVSCRRSFCGAGALAVNATYRWPEGLPEPESDRMGVLRYRFAEPQDLLGKTLGFNLYVDRISTPMNAQLGIVQRGRWRKVWDGPLPTGRGWTYVGGEISFENRGLGFSAPPQSVPVDELVIQVYLAIPLRNGQETWTGTIYLDDVGWR